MQLYATILQLMQLYATYETILQQFRMQLCNMQLMQLQQLYGTYATLHNFMQLYCNFMQLGVAILILCNYMMDRCGNFNFMQLNATICNCVGTKNVYWHDNLSSCFNECRYHQIGI
jgi:hypothetical protein